MLFPCELSGHCTASVVLLNLRVMCRISKNFVGIRYAIPDQNMKVGMIATSLTKIHFTKKLPKVH